MPHASDRHRRTPRASADNRRTPPRRPVRPRDLRRDRRRRAGTASTHCGAGRLRFGVRGRPPRRWPRRMLGRGLSRYRRRGARRCAAEWLMTMTTDPAARAIVRACLMQSQDPNPEETSVTPRKRATTPPPAAAPSVVAVIEPTLPPPLFADLLA